MRKAAGPGQPLGISVPLTMEEAEAITLTQVSEACEKMIREDRIDILWKVRSKQKRRRHKTCVSSGGSGSLRSKANT